MKFDMDLYLKICDITGKVYNARPTYDENEVWIYGDISTIIEDLVEAFEKRENNG